jgi:hypothetical protein
MADFQNNKLKALAGLNVLTLAVACAFGWLWHTERAKPPQIITKETVREVPKPVTWEVTREVTQQVAVEVVKKVTNENIKVVPLEIIKEVPKEVIKEVPVEVVKEVEVPSELSAEEEFLIDYAIEHLNAVELDADEDCLYGLDAFAVNVLADPRLRDIISIETIRNRFELMLRRSGIRTDRTSSHSLNLVVEGYVEPDNGQIVYSFSIKVTEPVVLEHGDEFRIATVVLWEQSGFGLAIRKLARQAILEDTGDATTRFIAVHQAVQKKFNP